MHPKQKQDLKNKIQQQRSNDRDPKRKTPPKKKNKIYTKQDPQIRSKDRDPKPKIQKSIDTKNDI